MKNNGELIILICDSKDDLLHIQAVNVAERLTRTGNKVVVVQTTDDISKIMDEQKTKTLDKIIEDDKEENFIIKDYHEKLIPFFPPVRNWITDGYQKNNRKRKY